MTTLEQSFVFICWKQVQHFDTLVEMKCSFSRMKGVIPTFPSTCFQKHKSQKKKINNTIHHSLLGTWMTIFGGPFTSDALCSYKTVSRLRHFEGLQWDHYYYNWQNSERFLTPRRHHRAGNGIRTQPNNCLWKLPSLSVRSAIECTLVQRKFQKQKIYLSMHFFFSSVWTYQLKKYTKEWNKVWIGREVWPKSTRL